LIRQVASCCCLIWDPIASYDNKTDSLFATEKVCVQLPAGYGPRLLPFAPNGCFAVLLTELSAQIFVFRWVKHAGRLDEVCSVALVERKNSDDRSASAFAMSDDGRFLHASNRRTAEPNVYAINLQTGELSSIQTIAAGGARPWSAELCPGRNWMVVSNQTANGVRVFAVNEESGMLSAVPERLKYPGPPDLRSYCRCSFLNTSGSYCSKRCVQ
jgi:6-phosphogluconolactonase